MGVDLGCKNARRASVGLFIMCVVFVSFCIVRSIRIEAECSKSKSAHAVSDQMHHVYMGFTRLYPAVVSNTLDLFDCLCGKEINSMELFIQIFFI